jgi:copper oxidase (laccase) domain-containing protein
MEQIIDNMKIEILIKPTPELLAGVTIPVLKHGTDMVEIKTGDEDVNSCDAVFTSNHDFSLGIKTADCAPLCITDGEKIGIAHVGWRGLCAGLPQKMLEKFDTENISVYVGPYIHSFEIQKDDCFDKIKESGLSNFVMEENGHLIFNSKEALLSLLPPNTIFDERDTFLDLSFPSYRRDKTSERFYTIVRFNV